MMLSETALESALVQAYTDVTSSEACEIDRVRLATKNAGAHAFWQGMQQSVAVANSEMAANTVKVFTSITADLLAVHLAQLQDAKHSVAVPGNWDERMATLNERARKPFNRSSQKGAVLVALRAQLKV